MSAGPSAARLLSALVFTAVLTVSSEARAVRFGLGLATTITPLAIDPQSDDPPSLRLGLRPVLDVEVLPWLAFDAYAPFSLWRSDADGPASSGAESVFGVGVSGRWRQTFGDRRERLVYGRLRGGFGTVDGRAGPFVGLSAGYADTWLSTGRGWFAELELGRLHVASRQSAAFGPEIDRWTIGASIGFVFRLGGTRWDL
jgi:hypothetical protein